MSDTPDRSAATPLNETAASTPALNAANSIRQATSMYGWTLGTRNLVAGIVDSYLAPLAEQVAALSRVRDDLMVERDAAINERDEAQKLADTSMARLNEVMAAPVGAQERVDAAIRERDAALAALNAMLPGGAAADGGGA